MKRDLYMWEETCERDLLTCYHTMTGSIWSALTTVISDCSFEVILSAAVDTPQFPGAQFTIQLPRGDQNDHCSMLLLFVHNTQSSSLAGSSICSKRGLRGTSKCVCHIFRRKPTLMSSWLPIISKRPEPTEGFQHLHGRTHNTSALLQSLLVCVTLLHSKRRKGGSCKHSAPGGLCSSMEFKIGVYYICFWFGKLSARSVLNNLCENVGTYGHRHGHGNNNTHTHTHTHTYTRTNTYIRAHTQTHACQIHQYTRIPYELFAGGDNCDTHTHIHTHTHMVHLGLSWFITAAGDKCVCVCAWEREALKCESESVGLFDQSFSLGTGLFSYVYVFFHM